MNRAPTLLAPNYVTCHMVGRLGNQMFQIANTYTQALKHNRQLILPRRETSVSDYFTTVYRKLDFLIDLIPETNIHSIQGTFHYTDYTPHATLPTVYRGYYQSEKYFKEYSESIRGLFGPTAEFVQKALSEYPQLKNNVISAINIRRGDYLNFPTQLPVLTVEYIHKAVALLPKSDYYFIVSDDLQWCKDNIKLPNCVFVPYERHEALWLLSLCDHFVISNSTFSWWAAWLSSSINKVVVVPSTWFGPGMNEVEFNPKDIACEGWIKMPSYYKGGMIVPD